MQAQLKIAALPFKMIQWFAKTLNRNGDATNSIGQNFRECFERRERIKKCRLQS
jgi:hypothetical protein